MKRLREAIALYRIYRQVNPPLRAARLAWQLAGD
jgi:hypothetical protein